MKLLLVALVAVAVGCYPPSPMDQTAAGSDVGGQRVYAFGAPASSQGGVRYTAGTGISIAGTVISSTVTASATSGMYGDGADGAVTFDGTSTVTLGGGGSLVPSSGVYTLSRDIFASSISGTATVKTNGYRVFCTGTTSGGIFDNSGNDGSGQTGGAGGAGNSVGAGSIGGGGSSGGFAGTSASASNRAPREFTQGVAAAVSNANGNAGGVGQGGSGGGGSVASTAGGNVTWSSGLLGTRDPLVAIEGRSAADAGSLNGGTGGGGGGNNGGNGGGGGGGGGWVVISSRKITGGTFRAKGGAGAAGVTSNGCGGGGGGGGVVVVNTDSTSGWTVDVSGGGGGAALGTGHAGGAGGGGLAILEHG